MTTKRQISRLLGQLVERNVDLGQFGRFIVIKPLRHVIRSISIDRTSTADAPNFFWSLGHLFNPTTSLQGICVEQFFTGRGAPRFWSQPAMPAAFFESAEGDILPMLRGVTTIDEMIGFKGARSAEFGLNVTYEIYRIHFSAAYGRFEEALSLFEPMKHWDRTKLSLRRFDFEHVADELMPLVRASDRAGIAWLLHEWEENTVRALGLEAIYEPTPFPLELQPG